MIRINQFLKQAKVKCSWRIILFQCRCAFAVSVRLLRTELPDSLKDTIFSQFRQFLFVANNFFLRKYGIVASVRFILYLKIAHLSSFLMQTKPEHQLVAMQNGAGRDAWWVLTLFWLLLLFSIFPPLSLQDVAPKKLILKKKEIPTWKLQNCIINEAAVWQSIFSSRKLCVSCCFIYILLIPQKQVWS